MLERPKLCGQTVCSDLFSEWDTEINYSLQLFYSMFGLVSIANFKEKILCKKNPYLSFQFNFCLRVNACVHYIKKYQC